MALVRHTVCTRILLQIRPRVAPFRQCPNLLQCPECPQNLRAPLSLQHAQQVEGSSRRRVAGLVEDFWLQEANQRGLLVAGSKSEEAEMAGVV